MTVASTTTTPTRMSIAAPRNDKAACIGPSFPYDSVRSAPRSATQVPYGGRTGDDPGCSRTAPPPFRERGSSLSSVAWEFERIDATADCDRIQQLHILARATILTKQTNRPDGRMPCPPD